jgi:hypothetical protein
MKSPRNEELICSACGKRFLGSPAQRKRQDSGQAVVCHDPCRTAKRSGGWKSLWAYTPEEALDLIVEKGMEATTGVMVFVHYEGKTVGYRLICPGSAHARRMISDFSAGWVGTYDQRIDLKELKADMEYVRRCLQL